MATPSLQQKLDALLLELLELPEPDRAAAIDRWCAGDAELRREAESFLSVLPQAETFFEQFAPPPAPPPIEGRRIGPYEIIGELGAGGMGRVYRARRVDGQFRSEVAIKIVSPLALGLEAQRRFAREKQLLANLKHENIAAIYDAGATPDGLPYLVMELVEGQPFDVYCRELGLRQKLEAFIQVCHAVAFAHQRLVVHRDLKPGNVLVTAEGQVKLLDFGIAKVLDDSELIDATLPENRVMTIATASPEQLRGEPVTTASDVYSLGVIFYQLLTGDTPYADTKLLTERIRRICEDDVPLPSRKTSGISSDLDNICGKALRKDPHERYHSARDFADDIQSYLEGRPVSATPPTFAYRARKFVRRNRAAVAAAGVMACILAGAVYAVVDSARVARAERDAALRSRRAAEESRRLAEERRLAAEAAQRLSDANRKFAEEQTQRAVASEQEALRRYNDIRNLALKVTFQYQERLAQLGTATDLRRKMIEDSLGYLDKLSTEKAIDPSMRFSMMLSYVELAKAQGVGQNQMGDREGARASLEKAKAQADALLKIDPRNLGYRRNAAEITCWFMNVNQRSPEECLEGWRAVARDHPDDRLVQHGVAYALYTAASRMPAKREPYLLEYLAIKERIAVADNNRADSLRDLALGHKNLASHYGGVRNIEKSSFHARKAVELDEQQLALAPSPKTRMDLAISYGVLADSLAEQGDRDGSIALMEKSVRERETVYQQDSANQFYRERLFIGRVNLAQGYRLNGRWDNLTPLLDRAERDARNGLGSAATRWRVFYHLERAHALSHARQPEAAVCAEVVQAHGLATKGGADVASWRSQFARDWPACRLP